MDTRKRSARGDSEREKHIRVRNRPFTTALCVHACVCTHACSHIHTHILTNAHTHTHTHAHNHALTHTYIHTRTHILHTCTHTHTHEHTHTLSLSHTHTHTDTQTHRHTHIHDTFGGLSLSLLATDCSNKLHTFSKISSIITLWNLVSLTGNLDA